MADKKNRSSKSKPGAKPPDPNREAYDEFRGGFEEFVGGAEKDKSGETEDELSRRLSDPSLPLYDQLQAANALLLRLYAGYVAPLALLKCRLRQEKEKTGKRKLISMYLSAMGVVNLAKGKKKQPLPRRSLPVLS
ncbi:MAG: hypothetical protein HZA02_08495 [Nitrospinae bacterium]|nr:hypothetical protein [Nitrospinota bacterium]